MDTTRELQLPGGFEEETGNGFRGKLDALKSRGLSKVHDIQRVVKDRGTAVQTSLRDSTKTRVARVNDSMRTNPMLWAGVAAASGFGLGMIGRIASWRSHRRLTPDLVIIETGC